MSETSALRRGRPSLGQRKQIALRLPLSLDTQVRALAEAERRSLQTQLEVLIELGLRAYGLERAAA